METIQGRRVYGRTHIYGILKASIVQHTSMITIPFYPLGPQLYSSKYTAPAKRKRNYCAAQNLNT